MSALDRPFLRPYVMPAQDHNDPHHVYLIDQLGLTAIPQRVTVQEFFWLRLFDGERTVRDIQAEAIRQSNGELFPLERIITLARKLEQARMLDGPRFREIVNSRVRPPRCIGCYEADPRALREQLEQLFRGGNGPGEPVRKEPDGRLRAALIPHIDYHRGGHTFAWGFKEVVESTDASLFVVIGTSHYSMHRFTLTRKDFETPLGVTPTDQLYIDRLTARYGDGLFDDEWMAHLPEHSIELEVVFLQYLYEKKRPIRIVPLVVGSFHDAVDGGVSPMEQSDICRMIEALRQVEAETPEPICYIISGDLAHIGPKFGDPDALSETFLDYSRLQDKAILRQAESADPGAFYRVIAEEHDARRICGLPPMYTVLEAVRPRSGKVLHYDQFVEPNGFESVSFASVGFYR